MTTLISEDEQLTETQIEPAGLPGVLENETKGKQEELVLDEYYTKSFPADEDILKEETTSPPPVVYQQGQLFPIRGYIEKLLSLFNKLLLYFFIRGDKQNKTNDSISLSVDYEYTGDECTITSRDNMKAPPVLSKLSTEHKGFDASDDMKDMPLPFLASENREDLSCIPILSIQDMKGVLSVRHAVSYSRMSYERKGFDARGDDSS
ncbi:uncharacterized protein LOC141672735 [Apium graveolens]|uniref:uncharacterized protein LOC141672735 n=1 Tax=Apium graveolens TaxID=4045 RepID=UPI003D7A5C5D